MCQEASWGVYGTMGEGARSVCAVVRTVRADVRTVCADVRTVCARMYVPMCGCTSVMNSFQQMYVQKKSYIKWYLLLI